MQIRKSRQPKIQQNKTTLVQLPLTTLGQETRCAYSTPPPIHDSSSVLAMATNQWRSHKFSTGGASICSIPFCQFPFICPTKSAVQSKNFMTGLSYRLNDWTNDDNTITLKNHIRKKLCIFLTGGAYAPYATRMATPLQQCVMYRA